MDSRDPSSNDEMLSGRMDCWSWNVDAADAKKSEGAIIIIIIIIIVVVVFVFVVI